MKRLNSAKMFLTQPGKILRTRNCRRKFVKNLLPEKRKGNM